MKELSLYFLMTTSNTLGTWHPPKNIDSPIPISVLRLKICARVFKQEQNFCGEITIETRVSSYDTHTAIDQPKVKPL